MNKAKQSARPHTDYDSPWKEVLERYFKEFVQFFFPVAYRGIDWSKDYEFLDKELQQIVRDAELGRRLVDKLVKVWTIEGDEAWVVVHIEVQGQEESAFAKRMYVYNYRLFDRYDRRVVSLAVLADDRESWRPKAFGYELWGCKVRMEFPIVKLLDYADREQELEASTNPFAIVALAYLKTRATRKNQEDRFYWKLRLCKLLYERGYAKEDILELIRFIDWIMRLPDELEEQFDDAMLQYEEEKKMQYVTTFERRGIQQGLLQKSREDIVKILQARFEQVSDAIVNTINAISDLAVLNELITRAATIESLEAFATLPELQA